MLKNKTTEVIEDLRNGKMVIILDDEDRENEGDLICAAEAVTPEIINFMATHGRGRFADNKEVTTSLANAVHWC